MEGFRGFPEGKLKVVPLPELFFSELLPIIDDLAELKVTLHCFWLFHQKREGMRYATLAELEADEALIRSLQDPYSYKSPHAGDRLKEGLERAVARGTLLQVTVQKAGHPDEFWYFMNSESGREAVARIERGEWTVQEDAGSAHLQARRPNIFNLYEQNLGLVSPMLAEELMDAEQRYPPEWLEDAFRIAVANNVRRWSYVRAILERWSQEGRGDQRGDQSPRRRDIDGKYGDLVRH